VSATDADDQNRYRASCVRKIYYKLNVDAETAASLEISRPDLY